MNIGYRRYSGPVWLDATKVKSKRGAWLEKRIALFRALQDRGHILTILKNGDDYSSCDKILVEFGSLNYLFHKEDIDFSNEILKSGKAIFILDDPDMMPKDTFGVPIWVNGGALESSKKWKRNCEAFPIYGLQEMRLAFYDKNNPHNGKIVYYGGTSGGRERLLKQYQVLIPELEIYGDIKDYKSILPKQPPNQDERAEFYSKFMACFNVTDNVHKKLKWNTGRKYHAILAGCPVLEEDMEVFSWIENLKNWAFRLSLITGQQMRIEEAKKECLNLFQKYGM